MTIIPELNAMPLGKMTPGELIRFRFRGRMPLGIVAKCDFLQIPSGMVVIVLEDLPDYGATAGGFLPITEHLMAQPSLSYGTTHTVAVHPSAPVASDGDDGFDMNGVLMVGGGTRTIRSRLLNGGASDFTLMIDVDKWEAVRTGTPYAPQRVAVLAWEVRLFVKTPLEPPPAPVFTFAVRG